MHLTLPKYFVVFVFTDQYMDYVLYHQRDYFLSVYELTLVCKHSLVKKISL